MKKWKVCIDEPFQNCSLIYPIQQRKVKEIIEHLQDDKNVKKIIIFGSSTTEKCHIGSDIDLYVELHEEKKVLHKAFDFVIDLWTNFTVDDRLYNEISKKGIVVYERNIP